MNANTHKNGVVFNVTALKMAHKSIYNLDTMKFREMQQMQIH
jgi:hypothetical protein